MQNFISSGEEERAVDDVRVHSAPAATDARPYSMSTEEAAQFEQFKRLKLVEQTKARISKLECDCLSPVATLSQLKTLCREAERLSLGGIVVLPAYVKACVAYLGDDPKCSLIAPVSYPAGGDTIQSKAYAVKRAVKDGVDEVEVYAPFSAIREGNLVYFKRECKKLLKAARPRVLRIALDCTILDESEIIRACNCAADCGVTVIRLVNAGGLSLITSAKSAVRDRCIIKADGHTLAAMEEAEALGVSLINCDDAIAISTRLLAEAQS